MDSGDAASFISAMYVHEISPFIIRLEQSLKERAGFAHYSIDIVDRVCADSLRATVQTTILTMPRPAT
jgi:hypothetical protein